MTHPPIPPNIEEIQWIKYLARMCSYEISCVMRCGWLDEAERIDRENDLIICEICRDKERALVIRSSHYKRYDEAIKNAEAWKKWGEKA